MGSMDMQPLIIGLIIAAVIGAAVYGYLAARKRRQELAAWAAAKGLTFDPEKDYGMVGRLPGFDCLRKGDGSNRYAYNIMAGRWNEREMCAFDYHYETHSTDSKGRRRTQHHHFSAVALTSPVPLKPLYIRPESFFDKVTEFFGYDDIDFESAEFSRKFYVKAPDKRWAYDVIHPRTMEFLLASPQYRIQFGRQHVMAFRESRFSVESFQAAAEVAGGILDRLPEYVVRQQQAEV